MNSRIKMRVIRGLHTVTAFDKGCAVTLGNFDGIHRGHQALIQRLKEEAVGMNVPTLVVIFEPQPLEYFKPQSPLPRLTRFREKCHQLNQLGIDRVLVLRFNETLAMMTAQDFIHTILWEKLKARYLLLGDDFHFGYQRQGDITLLQNCSQRYGFTVEAMPTFCMNSERVSSTAVRSALQRSDFTRVKQYLGRPYSMMGRVVRGEQIGRQLGFPTANLYLHRMTTPLQGIYAVRLFGVTSEGLPGVAYISERAPHGQKRSVLEVHLFDFNKNIYGRSVYIEFYAKLRDDILFTDLELLKNQIASDVMAAKKYFMKMKDEQWLR